MKNVVFIILLLSFVACGERQQTEKQPEVPRTVTFWDGYNFADTLLIYRPDITEQRFANFCVALAEMNEGKRGEEVDSLLTRAMRGSRAMFGHFMGLAEKYLNDPNSPYRHEESFIPFLQHVIAAEAVEEEWKIRPRFQLEMAMKNRRGTVANDFSYLTEVGKKGTLHTIQSEYLLLYFNNPECHDCERVKELIIHSPVITALQEAGRLKVLALYPDEDLTVWNRHRGVYPKQWITARYASEAGREAYHLPAIPNLYLLDGEKRVLLKDAPIEQIADWLKGR